MSVSGRPEHHIHGGESRRSGCGGDLGGERSWVGSARWSCGQIITPLLDQRTANPSIFEGSQDLEIPGHKVINLRKAPLFLFSNCCAPSLPQTLKLDKLKGR